MPKYALEFRVVEVHYYEVVADSLDDAEMAVYDQDLEPMEVSPIAYELDHHECISDDDETLTPAEYNQLRKENADWLAGKDKIGMP
jgi:hypothetical protein